MAIFLGEVLALIIVIVMFFGAGSVSVLMRPVLNEFGSVWVYIAAIWVSYG